MPSRAATVSPDAVAQRDRDRHVQANDPLDGHVQGPPKRGPHRSGLVFFDTFGLSVKRRAIVVLALRLPGSQADEGRTPSVAGPQPAGEVASVPDAPGCSSGTSYTAGCSPIHRAIRASLRRGYDPVFLLRGVRACVAAATRAVPRASGPLPYRADFSSVYRIPRCFLLMCRHESATNRS